VSQVNNDDVHQGSKVVYDNKDINLLLGVVRKKVRDLLLNMCSTLQNNSRNNILKCIVNYHTFVFAGTLKQMGI
jgi:hypothetical protein